MKIPDAKSATSAKLDLLDAICKDPRITAGEFRVAYILVQHRGRRGICPSQELVSLETGVKPRQVRNLIQGLVAKGWLRKARRNRQQTNQYEFDDRNVESVHNNFVERRETLKQRRALRKSDRQNIAAQETLSAPYLAATERQFSAAPERQYAAYDSPSLSPSAKHQEYLAMNEAQSEKVTGRVTVPVPGRQSAPYIIPKPTTPQRTAPRAKVDPIQSLNAKFGTG